MSEFDLNRRELIASLMSVGGEMVTSPSDAQTLPRLPRPESATKPFHLMNITLHINGTQHRLTDLQANTTLLDCLRDNLHLTGTKKGCGLGHCGACTVHVDGRRVTSCLTLAVMQQGRQISTIEDISQGEQLHPVQVAFIEHDGYQCGYCTPGQIMSAIACIQEGHGSSDAEIREWMSGNICRCGAYTNIVTAVRQAARRSA